MGFLVDKHAIMPPPSLDPNARDRFGLPLYWTLLEDDDARASRIGATQELIAQAVEAAIRQLGRDEAKHLFAEAFKEPAQGKRANRAKNSELLTAYDRELSANPADAASIPRILAEHLYAEQQGWPPEERGLRDSSPGAIEKRLRRAIASRSAKQRAHAKFLEMNPPTLLEKARSEMADK